MFAYAQLQMFGLLCECMTFSFNTKKVSNFSSFYNSKKCYAMISNEKFNMLKISNNIIYKPKNQQKKLLNGI